MLSSTNIYNILIFLSYVALSFSILYVFKAVIDMKRASLQVSLLFLLWFMFVFSCGVTHLTSLSNFKGHNVIMVICAISSISAAGLTVVFVRRLNSFIARQITLIEILKNSNLDEFMLNFDTVCTVLNNVITSGTIKGIRNAINQDITGSIRVGNVVKIVNEYIHISCIFDGRSGYNQETKDMVKIIFPKIKLDIECANELVLIIGQNVTNEWKLKENQLRIADAKLSMALTTAHDLRTPIMNFELLIGCIITNKNKKNINIQEELNILLEDAVINIELMKNVISQTLDVGRLVTNNKLKPKIVICNTKFLLKRLQIICKVFETNIPIIYNIAEDFPKNILTDSKWLWEICINLLSNACKYTQFGKIEFSLTSQESTFTIEVKDTGTGIPFSQRKYIFEKFTTLQTNNVETTGIGLYIVKTKAELLDGSVIVKDNRDYVDGIVSDGIVFVVTLPLLRVEKEDNIEVIRHNKEYSNLSMIDLIKDKIDYDENANNNSVVLTKSCLVVDDTATIRRMMCKSLERFKVDTAANGREALTMMKLKQYSIVFMDIIMPIMDGIICVKQLRQWEKETKRDRQYVVMLSANCIEEPLDFDECLTKPISYKRLIGIVEDSNYKESFEEASS